MKCKACAATFERQRPLQKACGLVCALNLAQAARAKKERAETRAQRQDLKPRQQWLREAQVAFNAFIRTRDALLPCISCNRYHDGKYDAGHYLSSGARPELRFDEKNCNRQCVPCNQHLHGNIVLYRAALIRRIGLAEVERLEGPQEPKKYDIAALRLLRNTYRARSRKLTKANA